MENSQFAKEIRLKTLEMLRHTGFGHIGASMSIVETLAVLFNEKMTQDDWFVLSKGHGGPSYYATLHLKGHFEEAMLFTLNQNGTHLPSHPDRLLIPGVQVTTGSLGQGISQAVGVAKGLKMQGLKGNVYCIVGDGEFNEGQVSEAIQFASQQKLDNFYLFIDHNKKQLDGYTNEVSSHLNYEALLAVYGYETKTIKGDDVTAISQELSKFHEQGKPKGIVLDTIKGQGVPYFENLLDNHHVRFSEEELGILDEAIENLKKELA